MFSSVVEMRMLRRTCWNKKKDNVRYEPIWENIGVVPIKDQMLLELLWPC